MSVARVRLRRVARILNGGTPPSGQPEMWGGKIPFVTPPDLNGLDGGSILSVARSITEDGLTHSTLAPKRSVLLSTRAPIGHIGQVTSPMAFNQGCRALVPVSAQDPRFLAYALLASRDEMDARGLGTTFIELSSSSLGEISVPFLAQGRQRAIADFLDRETAQIDAFIAKNEELISLLTERRDSLWDALYDEAVKAGRPVTLRRVVASICDGPFGSSLTSAHYSDTGTRVIRLGNLGVNEFKNGDRAFISDDYAARLSTHSAVAGDVIIAGLGDDRMPLGRACVLPEIGPAIVKADCYRVRPTAAVSGEYLAWALSAPPSRGQMALSARGSTRARLNTSVVLEVTLPVPPPPQQADLVRRFGERSSTLNAAVVAAQNAINLARERRAALISAAVTGKIDVGVSA